MLFSESAAAIITLFHRGIYTFLWKNPGFMYNNAVVIIHKTRMVPQTCITLRRLREENPYKLTRIKQKIAAGLAFLYTNSAETLKRV